MKRSFLPRSSPRVTTGAFFAIVAKTSSLQAPETVLFYRYERTDVMMKIALCQMSNSGSVSENLKKSIKAIERAAADGAQLILFPEVQLTEFFPQYPGQNVAHYRIERDSPVIKAFCDAAKDNHIMAVPNVYLCENGKPYDASLLIDSDGEILGVQKMVHIAQADKFFEQDYYTPADDGFKVFDTGLGKIGIVVCFDRHYPESVRTEALMGADIILIPTVNTKAEPSEMFEWELKVQAFHSSVFIAMCNRVGTEGDMDFSGESIVVDPNGDTVIKADDTEQLVYADLDLPQAANIRRKRPYTALRRPELYK